MSASPARSARGEGPTRGASANELVGTVGVPGALRQLLPSLILPGLIYFTAERHTSVLVALAAASSVPALDALFSLARKKRPSPAGLLFILSAAVSVALAMGLRSPIFVLAKGAVVSGTLGVAFAVSAAIRRPLTRTLAIALFAAQHEVARRVLAERWAHPKALAVFRVLSIGGACSWPSRPSSRW